MRQKVKERGPEKTEKALCHHFWSIEAANGPSSIGTCKVCGEKKEFFNAFPSLTPLKKGTNPFNLPRLPDVKVDKDNNS